MAGLGLARLGTARCGLAWINPSPSKPLTRTMNREKKVVRLRPTGHALRRFKERFGGTADDLWYLEWEEIGWESYRARYGDKEVYGIGKNGWLITVLK